jgi:hypothetical protein
MTTYMLGAGGPHEGVSEERMKDIEEAAARAHRRRSWKARRR